MSTSERYFPAIDGLRALAIASVFIYHIKAAWLPAGYLGVDIFFVVSGFVVSASVAQFRGGLLEFLGFFYSRRAIRIIPPLLIAIWLTTVMSILFIPDSWLSHANQEMAEATHLGLANLALMKIDNNYFSPQAKFNSFTQMWSLAVEEQFYVLFPFLFFLWLKWPGRRGLILLGLAELGTLSLVLASVNDISFFFSLQARFWELSAGVAMYQFAQSPMGQLSRRVSRRVAELLAVGALLSLGASLSMSPSGKFPSIGGVTAVFSVALMLLIFHNEEGGTVREMFCLRPVRALGRISYSLYLYHWPVIVLFLWTVGIESNLSRLISVLVSFGLAILSYHLIERPVKRWRDRTRLPAGWILVGFLAVIGESLAATRWAFNNREVFALTQVTKNKSIWYPDFVSQHAHGCNVTVTKGRGGEFSILRQANGCRRNTSRKKIFVLGDSHAMAYATLFSEIASQKGITVRIYTHGRCAFINFRQPSFGRSLVCDNFLRWSQSDILKNAEPGDILFLPSLRLINLAEQDGLLSSNFLSMLTTDSVLNRTAATQMAVTELLPFSDAGLRIVIEAPTPIFLTPPFRCADWFNRDNPVCKSGFAMDRTQLLNYREPVLRAMGKVQKKIGSEKVRIWDPFPVLCPPNAEDSCAAFQSGLPLFFDTHHLTAHANLLLFDNFAGFTEGIFAEI